VLKTVLFDVDGTLVESNDAHAHAWVKAFADAGVRVEFEKVRSAIGMGADNLMPMVAGIQAETALGKRISKRRGEIFTSEHLPHVQPLRDAGRLVHTIESLGIKAVAASSAQRDELEALLKIADAASLLGDSASGDDADQSKPDPDIVHAALDKAGANAADAVMIGDTPYDVEAASRAGVKAIAFRCGGWSDSALGGAIAIYDGPWHLLERLDDSPIAS
jgi:phosphoglycolate phosphatase-like HAD superfamily hydrolase